MFFGGKPKPEAVSLSALDSLLNSSFDSKLAWLEARASRTAKELLSARSRFSEACRRFEEVTAEPQLEYFFIDNVNFIKGQKLAYSKALRRIIVEWDASDGEAPTIHGRYNAMLSNAETFVNEVLRANTNFKKVLQAYPDHLDLFKGSFSLIEKLTESLRGELNRAAPALSEYRNLRAQLSKLHSLKEETEAMEGDISMNEAAGSGPESTEGNEEQRISEELSSKQNELSEIERESSLLHQKITHLTGPLERPSKKFDHIVQRKGGLNAFIKEPVESLGSESDYSSFKVLINEMAEQLDAGSIETKNAARLKESIAELLDADIYGMVSRYRLLVHKTSDLREAVSALEGRLARLREAKNSSRRASESKESMKRRATEAAARMDGVKAEVERLFLEYYNRRISIMIGQ
jgi:chromosome segregation ATPase